MAPLIAPSRFVLNSGSPGRTSIGNLEADCKETTGRVPGFFMFHPPLCPCYKKHAAFWNMKNAPNRPTQTGSENRVGGIVESSIEPLTRSLHVILVCQQVPRRNRHEDRKPSLTCERLDRLADRTGRSKTSTCRRPSSDLEDLYLAEQRLIDIRAGKSQTVPLEEVPTEDRLDRAAVRVGQARSTDGTAYPCLSGCHASAIGEALKGAGRVLEVPDRRLPPSPHPLCVCSW